MADMFNEDTKARIEKWWSILKDAMPDAKTRSGIVGMAATGAEILMPEAKWRASIMLLGTTLYGVCLIVKELHDYMQMKNKHRELEAALKDTWDFIDYRQPKIADYVVKIDQLFTEITGSQNTPAKRNEFEVNVHQLMNLVRECRMKLKYTTAFIKSIDDNLAEMEKLSNTELTAVALAMIPGLISLFRSGVYAAIGGTLIAGVTTLGLLYTNSKKEDKREELQRTIAEARHKIARIQNTWNINVTTVEANIEFLKKKRFLAVKDIQKWSIDQNSKTTRNSLIPVATPNGGLCH